MFSSYRTMFHTQKYTRPWLLSAYMSVCGIVFIFYGLSIFRPSYTSYDEEKNYADILQKFESSKVVKAPVLTKNEETVKYILLWTTTNIVPFSWMGRGRSVFQKNRCKYTNCYVTDNRTYFSNITEFDAIAFHAKELIDLNLKQLPQTRSVKQKYIFAMMESAHYYPVCDPHYDGFFNWTWTYRLDSDVRLGYVTIYDLEGRVVGPKTDMSWPESFNPISHDLKNKLKSKTKAAAWFVSNCKSRNNRPAFAQKLVKNLSEYNLTVDIYGQCGKLKCPISRSETCKKKLQTDYHFYFSFENSFAEDYVTEKLITALNNLAVPVVYGSANYSRFLPPGSYLNGYELGASELARTMSEIIADPARYQDMFRWRNHYRYSETTNNVDFCNLCALMNDEKRLETVSVHANLRQWWNIKGICH